MAYKNESDAACSECGSAFKLPFVPDARPFYCPTCNLKKSDMTKSKYHEELMVYLTESLEKLNFIAVAISPYRVSETNYDFVFTHAKSARKMGILFGLKLKGSKPRYLCTTMWEPKDPLRLITDGPIPRAIVRTKSNS